MENIFSTPVQLGGDRWIVSHWALVPFASYFEDNLDHMLSSSKPASSPCVAAKILSAMFFQADQSTSSLANRAHGGCKFRNDNWRFNQPTTFARPHFLPPNCHRGDVLDGFRWRRCSQRFQSCVEVDFDIVAFDNTTQTWIVWVFKMPRPGPPQWMIDWNARGIGACDRGSICAGLLQFCETCGVRCWLSSEPNANEVYPAPRRFSGQSTGHRWPRQASASR